jgi:glycosyltransferase involved in cell wall biosynthesis
VLDLCRHLSEYVDIHVVAPHTTGAALSESIENISVRRFRYFVPAWQSVTYQGGILGRLRENPWRVLQLPFFLVALWWSTLRLVRTWQPDIIHAHWVIPQGVIACLAAGNRVPVLCTSHGSDLHGLQSGTFQMLKRWTLRRCRTVTVVSRSMANKVRSLAPETSVEVIPMGTNLNLLFTPPADEATRRTNEIVFVGRLVETKGLRYLLQAFAAIQRTRSDLVLTIVGDGPMKDEVRHLISALGQDRSVRLPGGMRQSELPDIYRRATLAVFPYADQEGFGLVVVEAMGCGCPVIASDLPAIREIIEPGVTGILTPPGDSAALADALRQCLADGTLRSRLAMTALDSVRERFDWPPIAARYAQAIENCMRQ